MKKKLKKNQRYKLEKRVQLKRIKQLILRRRVIPKLQEFKNSHYRYKIAKGGRGSGKSMTFASLILQKANIKKTKVLCCREIQKSIEESVYALLVKTIEYLQMGKWDIKKTTIEHTQNGSRFIFHGLKDLRAANAIKSIEDVDICWIEEGQGVSKESLDILIPTIRKKNSEIWVSYNPYMEIDPVRELESRPRSKTIIVNWNDNPWFPEVLKIEKDNDYLTRPDDAEHIWGGLPRKQGQDAVMSRVQIRGAMDRIIEPEGAIEIGIDVARFGDDRTVIYKRHGYKVIDRRVFVGQDTMRTAKEAWSMAEHKRSITIKVDDTGVGGGVTDRLRELGAKIVPINFGGSPTDTDMYTSIADEMWFTFPIDEADIPCNNELLKELSGRRYSFDKKGRRKIESKKEYKKRLGYSPDDADALLLCYYTGGHIKIDNKARSEMARRRK